MGFVAAAIGAVWAIILGVAYASRTLWRLEWRRAVAVVVATYLILAGVALAWFGLNQTGLLGAFGMLLPCAAGCTIVILRRRHEPVAR